MKRKPYIGLILILLPWLLFVVSLRAAIITSTASGEWRKAATWVGGVPPVDGDRVIIAASHVISLTADTDTTITIGDDGAADVIDISGTLQCVNAGYDITLHVNGGISVNSGGSLIPNMSSDPTNYCKIEIDCATTDGKWGIVVDDGGICNWDGAAKLYATYATSNTAASQADIDVNGDITGWYAGDEIVVEGDVAGETAKMIILSIASQTVTCTGNFAAQHDSARKVVNLTRNVKFTSANASYRTYLVSSTSTQANFDMRYVECYHLRYGTFAKEGINLTSGAKGTIQYCSFHTGNASVIPYNYVNGGRNISYNVFYDCLRGIICTQTLSMIINNNYFMDLSTCIYFSQTFDLTFNNNFACDASGRFIYIQAPTILKTAIGNISRTNTIDIHFDANDFGRISFEDSYLQSSTLVSGLSAAASGSYIRINNLNGNTDDNRSYETYGTIRSTGAGLDDTFLRSAGTLALKMTPNSEDNPLEWEFTAPAKATYPVMVSGYLYNTDSTEVGDTDPTITISGVGVTEYTYTCDGASNHDSWEQFTVFGTPTRDGLATVTIKVYDYSGSNPDYYIDDIVTSAPQLNLADLFYRGLPAPTITATGLASAMDIWMILESINFGAGSMGRAMKDIHRRVPK